MRHFSRFLILAIFALSGSFLAACSSTNTEAKYPTGADRALSEDIYTEPESIFGEGGILGIGRKSNNDEDDAIGVNSYLWRASLDTISFMPLDQADPFGGVITTEWYQNPQTPQERLKLNVLILSKSLKSDGIRVKVFRQKNTRGTWTDMEASPATERGLEDAILTRARQLRVGDL